MPSIPPEAIYTALFGAIGFIVIKVIGHGKAIAALQTREKTQNGTLQRVETDLKTVGAQVAAIPEKIQIEARSIEKDLGGKVEDLRRLLMDRFAKE